MIDYLPTFPIDISNWLEENKVCIVTNSKTMFPGSLFLRSLRTYINCIPDNNFMSIPGVDDTGKPKYGLSAYVEMLNIFYSNKYRDVFDYAIYIDEDCFIKRFDLLIKEFKNFINGNYCLAGVPDGGMICHRNQSRLLVNTFLSFWNLKAIRENYESYGRWFHDLSYATKPYKAFIEALNKDNNGGLYKIIDGNSKNIMTKCVRYRIDNFKHDPPYASIVRNDPSNTYEPHQIPYSYKECPNANMEPYYLLEEAIVLGTKLPIYYLFGTDLYVNDENVKGDNSGLTTVVLDENNEHIAYHTWFARYYEPFVNNDECKKHVKRINSVIPNYDNYDKMS